MNTRGPFGGETGLRIRVVALAVFFLLALVFLATGDRRDALWFGGYTVIGLFETMRYYRRM